MRCHYEVLEIPREAEDSEIKTAYRKLALKWHPDKNLDNTEYAKEQFQSVQQAYEVLSDRQERAWYDKHREQILRGSNSDYQDNNLDVFQYFTPTCFKGYGDDEMGFYCVYGKVFEQIAKEDFQYMDGKEEIHNIPKFGNFKSNYDEVVAPFYDHWMSYTTKKSYVWLDPHDIKEAINRKIFKLIEKENDKIRQKAKKERNEEVRSLVAFVRKRDKRVQSHIKNLEAKKMENREKQKKFANQKRLERMKQLNESNEQAEWMKFDNVKTELEEMEKKLAEQFGDDLSDSDDNSDEEDLNNLYCVACNKNFKTPKAFKNHESSKKHKENIENLKDIMASDNFEVEDESFSDTQIELSNKSEQEGSESYNSLDDDGIISESHSDVELEDVVSISENKSNKKKNKKSKNVIKIVELSSDDEKNNDFLEKLHSDSGDEKKVNSKKQKRNRKKDKQPCKDNGVTKNDEMKSEDNKRISIQDDKENGMETELDNDKCCAKCKAQFPSKNKLFEHLKKTGHNLYLNSNVGNAVRTKKKGIKQK